MLYVSTRGGCPAKTFDEVILTGLAADGGLFVPQTIPHFAVEDIASWAGDSYQELAFKVMHPFVGGCIPDEDLVELIRRAYGNFRHEAIAPLVQTGHNEWILELFHGPTLAFKDFALQFLGHLLDYSLEKRDQKVVIMGATSGDTGSAAIEGCRSCSNVEMFILHPHQRVSDVQRRQMTTVLADNIHNVALQGNFDDCQNMVKACFSDQSFLPENRQLVAVNSINWARIMAQIVYYFWAALQLGGPQRAVSFAVPTGNFGDIFAGYLAAKMGLPIEQLVIATNQNDILHRCISANDHRTLPLQQSLAPSMDIMISSNFERLLFHAYRQDGDQIAALMAAVKQGHMRLSDAALAEVRQLFSSHRCDDASMLAMIDSVYSDSGYLMDPHTAIGLGAARSCRANAITPMITLATAHPAKFPDAVRRAGYPEDPQLPAHMADLFERAERFNVLDNDRAAVEHFMSQRIGVGS
jgi:threonine synthase